MNLILKNLSINLYQNKSRNSYMETLNEKSKNSKQILNLSQNPCFSEKCYDLLKKVPKGKVTTYKEIAKALNTKAYRAVGNAMNKNPYAPQVPCHRVVSSDGSIGGFAHGQDKKIEILKKEGINIENNKIKDFEKVLFKF